MTITITDTQLADIIRESSERAAKIAAEAAVKQVLALQNAGKQQEQHPYGTHEISEATEDEAKATMDAMAANLDKQDDPKVGIFWYQVQGERLFGVVAVNKDSFAKPKAGGELITCAELHKDVWKKKFHEQKYKLGGKGPYTGDYKDHERGRIFYNPRTDTYQIMVGSWIKGNEKAIDMIVEEFNLQNTHYEVKISQH